METPIKLILTDDHRVMVDSLQQAFAAELGFDVVGTAHNAQELFQVLGENPADGLLLDLNMPGWSGPTLCQTVCQRYPSLQVIILSMEDDDEIAYQLIRTGISGYVLKSEPFAVLKEAIHLAMQGEVYISRNISRQHINRMRPEPKQRRSPSDAPRLTQREKQVLKLLVKDLTQEQIAETMNVSSSTVYNHKHNIMEKLGVRGTAALIARAYDVGLLPFEGDDA